MLRWGGRGEEVLAEEGEERGREEVWWVGESVVREGWEDWGGMLVPCVSQAARAEAVSILGWSGCAVGAWVVDFCSWVS